MASEPPVGHPCHQLSNPSARMFWCRHCMTGFPDPMQRWRHSKECKAISSQKKYGGLNQTSQHNLPIIPKCDSPAPSPQSETSTPNKKKKSLDLKCYICKREFITINEMRDHVKRPCNKPEIKNPLKDTLDSLILTNEEDSDDSISQNEDKVTNQIETLLKAAQILQQKKDQLVASTKNGNLTSLMDRRMSDSADIDELDTEEMVLDVNKKGRYANKGEVYTSDFAGDSEEVKKQQALDHAEKMGNALKIYDFISDTPEPSPGPPDTLPGQPETSPRQPEMSPCQPDPDSNSDQVSTDSLNKTYVSSLQPHCSDSNKIPKITLKLVSGEKPKAEVWGIGTDLPKRIRKRKSKDFFDDVQPKVKKKEITLKEMQDKMMKNKAKLKVDKKKIPANGKEKVVEAEKTCEAKAKEKDKEIKTEKVKEKGAKTEKPKDKEVKSEKVKEKEVNNEKPNKKTNNKVKKKEVKATTKTRTGRIVGKKNLVVLLTDCLTDKKSGTSSKRQKASRSVKASVHSKQRPNLKTRTLDKSKTINKNSTKEKNVTSDNKGKSKKDNSKNNKQTSDKKNDKSKVGSTSAKEKSTSKQKSVSKSKESETKKGTVQKSKEKPVKCKACDRVFRTRDLLIKHNQIPCRMRNTRNMTQIILRPKKHVSHTLPLTQRQINAAKRRKQVAGKLSILDNSVKKEDIVVSEKTGKSKKSSRSRKRLTSPYFTFCITPKDKSQIIGPIDLDSLSEKDQYFYKLGMYSTEFLNRRTESLETVVEAEKVVSIDLKPCEISIDVDVETRSQPSFTSVGSEISPPILEKMSEISVECEEQNEKGSNITKMNSSQISPPNIVDINGAPSLPPSTGDKLHRIVSPCDIAKEKSVNVTPCSTPPHESALSLSDSLLEEMKSPSIPIGAGSSINKTSSQLHVKNQNPADSENDKENIFLPSVVKQKEVGVFCNVEDILSQLEKCKHYENFAFGCKLIKPRKKSFVDSSCIDTDISSQFKSSHLNGTNRKLTYTVSLGIQTEQSVVKTKTRWMNKSLEMENALQKENLKVKTNDLHSKVKVEEPIFHSIEKAESKNIFHSKERAEGKNLFHSIEKGDKNVFHSKEKTEDKNIFLAKEKAESKNIFNPIEKAEGKNIFHSTFCSKEKAEDKYIFHPKEKAENMNIFHPKEKAEDKNIFHLKEKLEDRNVFHSIEDLISEPKEKKESILHDSFMDSLLPSTKVTFDDIIAMENTDKVDLNSESLAKVMEKPNFTEVEITLPNKSKVAQLYTDIDWLALSDSDEGSSLISPKIPLDFPQNTNISFTSSKGNESIILNSSENPSLSSNKVIPNYDRYKHVFETYIDYSVDGKNVNDSKPSLNEKPKVEEVYVHPKKPIMSENEPVSVTGAKSSKLDEQMNLKTSNNLLDLISKTMGIIPESAKEKFEKSVLSFLTTASSPSDIRKNKGSSDTEGSQVIIVSDTTGANEFSSDITVIDDRAQIKIETPDRVGNDHVIRPSNFCSFPKTTSDLLTKQCTPSPHIFSFCSSDKEAEDSPKTSLPFSVNNDRASSVVSNDKQKQNNLLTSVNKYSSSNLDDKSNCIASRRRSPRPPNIITSSQNHLDVFSNGNKDDVLNVLSDLDSPTIITNFDFEKYAEHLKEETFYTTQPLSPIRPVSLMPSCDQPIKDELVVRPCEKFSSAPQEKTVIVSKEDPLNLTTTLKGTKKSDGFLKPLAIDCSQGNNNESYICDISPPLEGTTQHISPVDLAKVATAKMTNELILKSQGLAQGLLQMSAIRPTNPQNIAFLPPKSSQLYVSPSNYSPVAQQKSLLENIVNRNRLPENLRSPKVPSPMEGVQYVDIHLNSQNPVSSAVSNIVDGPQSTGSTLYASAWDKRQNVIVSHPFNQLRPKQIDERGAAPRVSPSMNQVRPMHIAEQQGLSSPPYNQVRPKQVRERPEVTNKKQRHSVNILRNNNRTQDRQQDTQSKTNNSNTNRPHPSLISQSFSLQDNTHNVVNSSKASNFLSCNTEPQDALLDMLDKSHKQPNQFNMLGRSNDSEDKFRYQQMHPKFVPHQRHNQLQNVDKMSPTLPKPSATVNNFPGFQRNEAVMPNSRLAPEQLCRTANPKFENAAKESQQILLMNARTQRKTEQVQRKANIQVDRNPRVPSNQEAMMLNSRIVTEQLHQRPNLSNMPRSHSFDQTNVKNEFSGHPLHGKSVIHSPNVNPSCNFSSPPKGSVFDCRISGKPPDQGIVSAGNSRLNFASQRMDSEMLNMSHGQRQVSAHVQRQLSAPSNLGNTPRTSTNIVPNTDYEDVSSPEEVEVYPTTPREKQIPQKASLPYRLEHETLSLHSMDKNQGTQLGIPHSFNFKSSLDPSVQYRDQRTIIESGNRIFTDQRPSHPPPVYQGIPPRPVPKSREVYPPPSNVQFNEFCQNPDISDSILDNI